MNFVLKVTVLQIVALIVLLPVDHVVCHRSRHLKGIINQDLVTNLPGQPRVDFNHYAGYVTVNESNGRALFYWFYEATTAPAEKPLVLWLNGGPGCSSVGYGATQEIGPFLVNNKTELEFNPYSWNINANMLFLESPVGVGFSYSNTTSDYSLLGDDFAANDAYSFLQNWFLKFPSYRNRTFYIAGESYAGKYVPELAELIHDKNSDPSLYIGLKGFMVGNPETADGEDWRGIVDYAWSHAVISDELHSIITETCDFKSNDTWSNKNCSDSVDAIFTQYNEIDIYSLYTPFCLANLVNKSSAPVVVKRAPNTVPRIMSGFDPCLDNYAKAFYNIPAVQQALHAINIHQPPKNWSICNQTIFQNWLDSKPTVIPIYQKLIAAGLRIWVYSGDTDGRVPVLATRYSLSTLGLPITQSWRPWYHQRQVSGWVQEYKGLTFATFRGAGHDVPSFKPSESLAFFSYFLQGKSPPNVR